MEEEDTIDYQGLGFLFSYLRPYKQLLGQLLLGLLLGSLIQLLLPFLTQSIVDFGISNQNLNYVYLVLLAQLMLTFSSSTDYCILYGHFFSVYRRMFLFVS